MLFKFLTATFFIPFTGICCSCLPLAGITEADYNSYQLILKGKVTQVIESNFERILEIKVAFYYKGSLKTDTVRISTPLEEGMCGINPGVGDNWLIFAYADRYYYRTNLCTRTRNMNPDSWNFDKDELQQDLEFLEDKLKHPSVALLPFMKSKIPLRQAIVKD
jgi:hypothetical protein